VWAAGAVLLVLASALALLAQDPRYFFHGDTQAAYLGWEYRLGEQVRAGHWPLLDPHAWAAGNAVAEGQWGLFSPLVVAIGLLATVSANVLAFATAVKLALLCVGALGVFALARSYGARAPLAFVAAVAAPFGGMTQYLDLPSWVAALMIWALLPWVWWALRRTMFEGTSPLPALALGYLLVTVGYVYGTIMLILVLAACLLDARVARSRTAALKVVGVAVVCGLVAFTVYLPGVLTAPVTIRGSAFDLTGKFASDPLALFAAVLPTAVVPETTMHLLPYAYVAWFLPLLLWLDVDELRRRWRPLAGLVLMSVLMVLVVLGPARVGPLRWPLRLQPFLVLSLVVLCAVLLSGFVVRRPSVRRLLSSLLWVLLAGVAATVRAPELWVEHLVGVAVVGAGIAVTWWRVVAHAGRRPPRSAALAVAVFTMALAAVQHGYFAQPPSPERHMPPLARDYTRPLAQARGDVMVVGNTGESLENDASWAKDFLTGSAWYLNGHPVQNTYTTINFRAYKDRYCTDYEGSTCPALLDTLFSREQSTGARRVDLLGVSTLLLVRADFPDRSLVTPPTGWRVAAETRRSVTWVRRAPVPGAGRPVWTSPGTSVSVRSVGARSARFVVDRVPSRGGKVVLSALAWPGYRTDVGHLAEPVDGYLLAVDLPPGSRGQVVTVRFSPPGWPVAMAAWWLAVLGALTWSAVAWRRRGRHRPAPTSTGHPGPPGRPVD
jgi:hypothetical protein